MGLGKSIILKCSYPISYKPRTSLFRFKPARLPPLPLLNPLLCKALRCRRLASRRRSGSVRSEPPSRRVAGWLSRNAPAENTNKNVKKNSGILYKDTCLLSDFLSLPQGLLPHLILMPLFGRLRRLRGLLIHRFLVTLLKRN